MNLRDVIERIESLDDNQVVYGFPGDTGWTGKTPVRLLTDSESESQDAQPMQTGLRYFLEVDLLREVLAVWSEWRDRALPTTEEALEAVIHYAISDAYLPTE